MKKAGILLFVFVFTALSACKNKYLEEFIGTDFITPPAVTTTQEQGTPPAWTPQSQTQPADTTTQPPETTAEQTTELSVDDIIPPENANAAYPLMIRTYDGYNQPCHPKVLYFENGWNGYEYWMVYTPYPYCEDSLENPSIAVSHDGVEWSTPAGLVNPVTGVPPTTENSAHYSDPHILMNDEVMELWFRYNPSYSDGVGADSNGAVILRTTSVDGVNWSEIETVHDKSRADRNPVLSPVVMLDNGVYTMWYAKRDGKLYKESSEDLVTWTAPEAADLAVPGYVIWHQDMIKTQAGYEIVFCARPHGAKNNLSDLSLFYAVSKDGVSFSDAVKIISPGKTAHDSLSIYRSSILKTDGGYKIYYTCVNENYVWKICLTSGPSISELIGYGNEESGQ